MKPVAVMVCYPDGRVSYRGADDLITMYAGVTVTPLYTLPPKLTDEEIISLWGDRSDGPSTAQIVSFARAIEAKIRGESDDTR